MSNLEGLQDFCFTFFSIILISSSCAVVLIPNLVYAGFFLGAALVATAGLYLLLNADFLAAAQILLYVGGINVLILFGIMLIDTESRVTRASKEKTYGWLVQGGLLGIFYLLLIQMIDTTLWVSPPFLPATSSVETIGRHVFSDFLLPFELISVLLLIALLGVVVLARREQIMPNLQQTSPLPLKQTK
mgnify:CR=1 FL=1|jgi:NAD(P)H-quinone oxidoreductase subunit 6|tara:strand:+ start:10172 stop:10735 length:564 start_codon:yes stop_codon:yes gene_type:complete